VLAKLVRLSLVATWQLRILCWNVNSISQQRLLRNSADFYRSYTLASSAMGHWGTCPLDFQLFNFSGYFRTAQTLALDSMWLPTPRKNIGLQAYSFVTVYCMNFIIFLCATFKLFSLEVSCPPHTKSWRRQRNYLPLVEMTQKQMKVWFLQLLVRRFDGICSNGRAVIMRDHVMLYNYLMNRQRSKVGIVLLCLVSTIPLLFCRSCQ